MSISCLSSAARLIQALREREISAVEALQLFTSQNERRHKAVNAVCTLSADAWEKARQIDSARARGEEVGPLAGLPVSFKDSYETKGMRTTCGFPPLRDFIPQQDATVVASIRAAGGIPFAKTNVPPLLRGFHTDNPIFGRTNNPWNPERTAGGSSGGSAAALAAGMTPLDLASDMFGSIRVPAHFCGVAGLKPTQFRVSSIGHYPPLPGWPSAGNLLSTRGPMARCVEDLMQVFPLIAVPDPRDGDVIPMPLEASPEKPLSAYRVAWTDNFGGVPVTRETRAALERTALILEKAGLRVEKISPPDLDYERIWRAAGEVCSAILSFAMSPQERRDAWDAQQLAAQSGPLEQGSRQGLKGDLVSWMHALEIRLDLISQLRRFFASWDGWLVPTTCAPAFLHADFEKPINVEGATLPYLTAMGSYVTPFNFSGSPAVTFPAALSDGGPPIGLQLVGEPFKDMPLLRLAHEIEKLIGPLPSPPL